MEIVVLADLDGCLINQERTCQPGEEAVCFDESGQAVNFQTDRQRSLLDGLWNWKVTCVVPTTGRTTKAYRQIRLAFSSYAICSFGGVILAPWGEPDKDWHAEMESATRQNQSDFAAVLELSQRQVGYRSSTVIDAGLPLFIRLQHQSKDAQELSDLAAMLTEKLPCGWRFFAKGSNCRLQPPHVGKEKAVAWFLKNRCQQTKVVIGLGDERQDLEFLKLCHFVLMPNDSQLFGQLVGSISRSRENRQETPRLDRTNN